MAQTPVWESTSKQELIAAYQKACNWFINTPSYAFKIKYAAYDGHQSNKLNESSEGYYKRVAGSYISEAAGIKTLQNTNLKLVIDTADKIVTLMNPASLSPNMASTQELEELLNNVKALKKTKLAKTTKYRVEFNNNELYQAYEFTTNEKGLIIGLTYYYSEQAEHNDEENNFEKNRAVKIKPRLEITFSNFQIPANYAESEFDEGGIVTKEKQKISLKPAYSTFRLIDYRLQAKK
jgi:hypothetical protein